MEIDKMVRGTLMGLALGILAGTAGEAWTAEAPEAAPKAAAFKGSATKGSSGEAAAARAFKIMKGDSAAPLVEKSETKEAKARRQKHAEDLQSVRASAQRMDLGQLQAAREREMARREAERKTKSPMDATSETMQSEAPADR